MMCGGREGTCLLSVQPSLGQRFNFEINEDTLPVVKTLWAEPTDLHRLPQRHHLA